METAKERDIEGGGGADEQRHCEDVSEEETEEEWQAQRKNCLCLH